MQEKLAWHPDLSFQKKGKVADMIKEPIKRYPPGRLKPLHLFCLLFNKKCFKMAWIWKNTKKFIKSGLKWQKLSLTVKKKT